MEFCQVTERIISDIEKVIVGKRQTIELILVSFLSGGHVLLEDMPGLGKTMLVKAFSKSLGLPSKRIQFTPDLLPSDLTGINIYDQKTTEFRFQAGPLFTNIVLADEINRATPRTQSALLEAMEEKQVTIDGHTRALPEPFMVMATQNPVETFGTFPLPEAQLDRFMMRLSLGYSDIEDEMKIVRRNEKDPLSAISESLCHEILGDLIAEASEVTISPEVLRYLVSLTQETRNSELLLIGASPRASVALHKAARVYALMKGRNFIIPEDVRYLAPFVLNHRVMFRSRTRVKEATQELRTLLNTVAVPTEML